MKPTITHLDVWFGAVIFGIVLLLLDGLFRLFGLKPEPDVFRLTCGYVAGAHSIRRDANRQKTEDQ